MVMIECGYWKSQNFWIFRENSIKFGILKIPENSNFGGKFEEKSEKINCSSNVVVTLAEGSALQNFCNLQVLLLLGVHRELFAQF